MNANESTARRIVACDECNAELGENYTVGHKNISVSLLGEPESNGATYKKDYHFCDEGCMASFLNKRLDKEKDAHSSMAKVVTQCDNCKTNLKKDDGDKKQHLQATLANGKDESQQYHYCDEECLRQHLNGRAKRKKERSTASFAPGAYFSANGSEIVLDIMEDESFARKISYKERNSPKEWFIDEKRKSFPVMNCKDVSAVMHRIGTYKGEMSEDEIKSKLKRRAKELGCENSLPDTLKD